MSTTTTKPLSDTVTSQPPTAEPPTTEPAKKKRRISKKKAPQPECKEAPQPECKEAPQPECKEAAQQQVTASPTETQPPASMAVEPENTSAPAKMLLIKNKATEFVKQLGCSMSHAHDKGTLKSAQKVLEAALVMACTEAKKRNKKAERPQVTMRDFEGVYAAIDAQSEIK
jgi:hypothetical protein